MIPVITVMRKATNEMPPRQYSGYQYQTVFNSYFSVGERGSCRCTVSTLCRVTSAQGTVGKRSLTQPNRKRLPRPTGSFTGISLAMRSPAERRVPAHDVRSPDDGLGVPHQRLPVPLEAKGDGRKAPRRGPVDELRPDVLLAVRVGVPFQAHGVVLGVVALAPDGVLPVEQRLRVRAVVLVRLRDRLHVPSRVAAEVDAPVVEPDEDVAVVQMDHMLLELLRDLEPAVPRHADEERGQSRARDEAPLLVEQPPPHRRGPLPQREVHA